MKYEDEINALEKETVKDVERTANEINAERRKRLGVTSCSKYQCEYNKQVNWGAIASA